MIGKLAFSDIEFNLDKDKNLTDFCDFIVSLSPEQLFIKSPMIAIVEAKNENIMGRLGQCIAEMVAVKVFNEKEGNEIPVTYEVVTSGIAWKFLKLESNTIYIDLRDSSICLLYTSPSPRDGLLSRMPSSA